jgi:N-acetylglutamate synthase-like GNAT family acetyltransferase
MKEAHLPEVRDLSEQLGYPVTMEELASRWKKLSQKTRHGLFVYEENGNIKGWIHLECVEDLIEEEKVEIKALVVSENSRGNGIGKALIATAEKWAKTYQLHTIYLNCNILRERTHQFYEREGFTKYKTSHFFEKKI